MGDASSLKEGPFPVVSAEDAADGKCPQIDN